MIADTLDSHGESLVLSFLLVASDRAFSEHELMGRLGLSRKELDEALAAMTRRSQVKVCTKKGKKYYLLNHRYDLVPELKSALIRQMRHYEDELFSAIKKLGGVKAAYLSGIFAGHADLPVDILLVGDVHRGRLADFIKACEDMMEQEINYAVLGVVEFKERRNTFDRFLKDVFDYRHTVVMDTLNTEARSKS